MLVVTAAVAIVCPAVLGAAAATVTQSIATSALVGSAISGIMNGAASYIFQLFFSLFYKNNPHHRI